MIRSELAGTPTRVAQIVRNDGKQSGGASESETAKTTHRYSGPYGRFLLLHMVPPSLIRRNGDDLVYPSPDTKIDELSGGG